jgi:hypothetical protein
LQGLSEAVYKASMHGSVRGMMLDMIIQHHPTRFLPWIIKQPAGQFEPLLYVNSHYHKP